jgi:hypothetical protein
MYVILSLTLVGVILSYVSFIMVLKTETMQYKYMSNIGWISSAFTLIGIFIISIIFSVGGSVMLDLCKTLDSAVSSDNFATYPGLM